MSEIYRVFESHRQALRRVVQRHKPAWADTDDLLQEAFLRAYAAEMKRGVDHPKAFLFTVARNTALGELRSSEASPIDRTVDYEETAVLHHTDDNDATKVLDGRRKLYAFTMAVLQLPPRCRRAFLLRRVDGLSFKQIANRMGISVSAAEKHVAMGLLRCSEHLANLGYQPGDYGPPETGRPEKGRVRTPRPPSVVDGEH